MFFGGSNSLALVAHVSFLGLLQLRKKIVDILDGDKGPCEVVALSDALEPGCLCGEFFGAVKISYCCFGSGELVYVVDCVNCTWADVVENFKVREHVTAEGAE